MKKIFNRTWWWFLELFLLKPGQKNSTLVEEILKHTISFFNKVLIQHISLFSPIEIKERTSTYISGPSQKLPSISFFVLLRLLEQLYYFLFSSIIKTWTLSSSFLLLLSSCWRRSSNPEVLPLHGSEEPSPGGDGVGGRNAPVDIHCLRCST